MKSRGLWQVTQEKHYKVGMLPYIARVHLIGGLQPFPKDLKDKSKAAMLVDGTKESGPS